MGQNLVRKKEYITYELSLMKTSKDLDFRFSILSIIFLKVVVGRDLMDKSIIVLLEQTCCMLISPFFGAHECKKTLMKYAFFYLAL